MAGGAIRPEGHRVPGLAAKHAATVELSAQACAVRCCADVDSLPRNRTPERLRAEQVARDYWAATYGVDAERRSRGGVSWLGVRHA